MFVFNSMLFMLYFGTFKKYNNLYSAKSKKLCFCGNTKTLFCPPPIPLLIIPASHCLPHPTLNVMHWWQPAKEQLIIDCRGWNLNKSIFLKNAFVGENRQKTNWSISWIAEGKREKKAWMLRCKISKRQSYEILKEG